MNRKSETSTWRGLLGMALLLCACTSGVGCALQQEGPSMPPPPPVEIGGGWTGTWRGDSLGAGSVRASFVQNGTQFDGTVSVSWSLCGSNGTVHGSVDDHALSMTIYSGGTEVALSTTYLSPTQMTGRYTVLSGLCWGNTGSFTLTR